ncbi:hypothetical protein [uncultured Microbulbifer sp.]|uniref:hypothetical protein n=1 Tax=uncultured Microbulbifer sp. TaxID=348147 RepID=UPI00262CE699|nr:hypothetical protein [uncultured Microbulbifer sp.]
MKFFNKAMYLAIAITAAMGLAACSEEKSAESIGETIDDTITDTGNAIEDACEDVKEGANAKDTDC